MKPYGALGGAIGILAILAASAMASPYLQDNNSVSNAAFAFDSNSSTAAVFGYYWGEASQYNNFTFYDYIGSNQTYVANLTALCGNTAFDENVITIDYLWNGTTWFFLGNYSCEGSVPTSHNMTVSDAVNKANTSGWAVFGARWQCKPNFAGDCANLDGNVYGIDFLDAYSPSGPLISLTIPSGGTSDSFITYDNQTTGREYYANATGSMLTHCNLSSSLGGSFSSSDFNLTNELLTVTFPQLAAGLSTGTLSLNCTENSTVMSLSINVLSSGGTGGGSGSPPSGFTVPIDPSRLEEKEYYEGDGICDILSGESASNSADCRFDITKNSMAMFIVIIILSVIGYATFFRNGNQYKTRMTKNKWRKGK